MKRNKQSKLAILAAGRGRRMGDVSNGLNKALLPINFKAVISHILEKFPVEMPVIVAVGHERRKIQEYLALAHQERDITLVEVDKIDGPGSGPGYSLLHCRHLLQTPFVLSMVDTIVEEDVPEPSKDWLGIAPVKDTSRFNSVKLKMGLVQNMLDKEKSDNTHAFIGLAGINSYERFWEALEGDDKLIQGEKQLSNGLKALVENKMVGVEFTWHDTGTRASYRRARESLAAKGYDFSFSKPREHLYFVGKGVIKYFGESQIATKRVRRAQALAPFTPKISGAGQHFYRYEKIPGHTMYEGLDEGVAKQLYRWLQEDFWKNQELSAADNVAFERACLNFYKNKTKQRVAEYFTKTQEADEAGYVNGVPVPKLEDLLDQIDWSYLACGQPARIHGDLQFDNIIVTEKKQTPFVLIDWRQDFSGLIDYGDLYYDLAKLRGGHIIPYDRIKQNRFKYKKSGQGVRVDVETSYVLNACLHNYHDFLKAGGYDMRRVEILTGLIYLNMSPLHEKPFDFALHHLGKLELQRALKESSVTIRPSISDKILQR